MHIVIDVSNKRTFQHAGYDADPIYNVTGFSQLHDDGTGGVSSLPGVSHSLLLRSTVVGCPIGTLQVVPICEVRAG